jgi:hypothetical protein
VNTAGSDRPARVPSRGLVSGFQKIVPFAMDIVDAGVSSFEPEPPESWASDSSLAPSLVCIFRQIV